MAKKRKIVFPKRGEFYLVQFDPTVGVEIKKTRPALVLQDDILNQYGDLTIVAPITSQIYFDVYPFQVFIEANRNGLDKDSLILLNQMRAIDKRRLVKKLGICDKNTMQKVNEALLVTLGMADI